MRGEGRARGEGFVGGEGAAKEAKGGGLGKATCWIGAGVGRGEVYVCGCCRREGGRTHTGLHIGWSNWGRAAWNSGAGAWPAGGSASKCKRFGWAIEPAVALWGRKPAQKGKEGGGRYTPHHTPPTCF